MIHALEILELRRLQEIIRAAIAARLNPKTSKASPRDDDPFVAKLLYPDDDPRAKRSRFIQAAIKRRGQRLALGATSESLTEVEAKSKLIKLVTAFHTAYADPLNSIQNGKSTGYTMVGEQLRGTLFGKLYRTNSRSQDVEVIKQAIKIWWNGKPYDHDLVNEFEAATSRISGINNLTRVFIDVDILKRRDGFPEPHDIVLDPYAYMECERFGLHDMCSDALKIIELARFLLQGAKPQVTP